jgi:hypothetical protein
MSNNVVPDPQNVNIVSPDPLPVIVTEPLNVTLDEPIDVAVLSNVDTGLEVARGNVAGHSYVNKFGRNPDIDTGGFETIWNGGASYTGHDAVAAEITTLSSSNAADTAAGTGARTVEVYGLDASYLEISEVVTLLGTTLVDTTLSYIRLNRMIVRSAGTGGVNVGTLNAAQKITTANIFAVMPIGYNQTMICAYTIPAGKTGYMTSWGAGLSGKTNSNCNVKIRARPFGEVFQVKEELSVQGAGTSHFNRKFAVPNKYAEKTDLFIEADTDTNNTAVAADFDIVLVDN